MELFQILKHDAVKVLHSICQQIWKPQQWPQDWKRSVFIPIPEKGNAKECSNYHTIALISHSSKVMPKILQVPDVQAGFRKGRRTRDQITNIRWIIEKAKEFQKNIYFCFIDYAKAFDYVDHNNLWKILRELGIPDHLTYLLRNLYAGQKSTAKTINGKVLLLLLSCFSRVQHCVTPQTAAHQTLPSLGFSRQEHWSGLPFPSPMHESEK